MAAHMPPAIPVRPILDLNGRIEKQDKSEKLKAES
jgi:hypothetical protein